MTSHNQGYLSRLTGRRRKLSDGAMIDICNQFANNVSVASLAKQYGVSINTIYSTVYWTPRKPPAESLPAPVSNEQEFVDKVRTVYDELIDAGKEFSTSDILMAVGYGTPGEVMRALGKETT